MKKTITIDIDDADRLMYADIRRRIETSCPSGLQMADKNVFVVLTQVERDTLNRILDQIMESR